MGFLRWFLTGETEAHEFHRKLDGVKRELKGARRDLDAIDAENKRRREERSGR